MMAMSLSSITVWIGVLEIALALGLILTPSRARRALAAFPRSRGAAWGLTAVAMTWAGWLLYNTPLGGFERYKPVLVGLLPVAFFLVVLGMDELLAPRALGGLMLLIPEPILRAGRFHPSPWRYVMLVLAYLMVVKGLALVLSPYLFRRACERMLGTDSAARLAGFAGLGAGVALVLIGWLAY